MKPNYLLIFAVVALCFCVAYLITSLIVKQMYVDAAFASTVVLLFVFMIYSFNKKGNGRN